MNAPPFPLNPAVGQRFGNWVWNGTRWVSTQATGVQVITTVFLQSAPYQPSPGLVSLIVRCTAGGGGGGAAINNAAAPPYVIVSGSGGGAGEFASKTLPAALVLGGVLVTVGAGGAGSTGANNAGIGGDTLFGAYCVARGGNGATDMVAEVAVGVPGDGGGWGSEGGGAGDFGYYGASGMQGTNQNSTTALALGASGGMGGANFGGNKAVHAQPSQIVPGASAQNSSGAGGTGGVINQAVGTAVGGAGGSGLVVIDEFCWGDIGDDCCQPTCFDARVAVTREPGPCPPWQDGM